MSTVKHELLLTDDGIAVQLTVGKGPAEQTATIRLDSNDPDELHLLGRVYAELKHPAPNPEKQGYIHVIPPKGPITIAACNVCPPLESFQELVEGYIEMVNCIHEGEQRVMIVNEDHDGLEYNERATELYQAFLSRTHGVQSHIPVVGTVALLIDLEMS